MKTPGWKRLITIPVLGAVLVLSGCIFGGPSAELVSCEPTESGAEYTISVSNDDTNESRTVHLVVSEYDLTFKREGEKKTLEPGESGSFTVTIERGKERHVRVLWPAPQGDETYKYDEKLDGEC